MAINDGLHSPCFANAAGNSVEMVERHYHNGDCAMNREMLTSVLMRVEF